MANLSDLFKKASLTLVDVFLLVLCAVSLAYLCVPSLAKLGVVMGNAVEPNKHADIQIVGVIVFLGVFLVGVLAVFCAAFAAGSLILAMVPNSARLFVRIGLVVVLLPVFIQTARRGPHGYFDWLINPSIRENETKQESKTELNRKLKESQALSVKRQPDGIKIINNTDQLVRVQVAFISRSNDPIYQCYPGQSATLPPSPSDEEMNLPSREARLFLFGEAHTGTGSQRLCGFDDYAVWGWDEKGVPVFLSQKAHLY
jgi:hypothetical protein